MRRRLGAIVGIWLALGGFLSAQPVPPGTKVTLGVANAVAIINTTQDTIVTVQIQGTWTGTQSFEGSLDGSTYTATSCTAINSTTAVTSTTANGIFSCSMVGINFFQTRFSAYGSGTATVSYQTAYLSGSSSGGGGGSGGNVSIVQGGNTAGVNASSQLSVNCANCSGSGVSQVDNTGFTPGTTNFVPVGGEVDDVGTTAVSENNAGATRITGQRGLHVNLRTNAGAETGIAGLPLQVSLANTAANATAVKVDGSAVTQPVSGTVTSNMGTVAADPFGANADASSATGSISAKLRFIANTGIPITGTVTVGSHNVTNAGTFATQSAITAASGSIASGAVASGAIASGAVASGAIASGAYASGSIGSGAIASGAVASGAYGSDSGSFGVGSTGSAPPAKAVYSAGVTSGATGGLLGGITVCDSRATISLTTNTQIISGTSSRHIYICSINLVVAAATNVAIVSGTGSTCGTGTGAMAGGTTAATGWNFAANGGIAQGNGLGWIMRTGATGDNVCVLVSAANQTSGVVTYAVY